MMKQITNNIFKITLPCIYASDVNCYLIEQDDSYLLIDTGENNEETLLFWKNLIPRLEKPISHVLLTHTHTDHIGCCNYLQQLANVKIITSKHSKEKLISLKKSPKNNGLIEAAAQYGYLYPYSPKSLINELQAHDFDIHDTFEDGETIQIGSSIFQAIATPGHSNDLYCFYEEKTQILFASDHLIREFNPVLIIEKDHFNPLKSYFQSLNKIKHLQCNLALSGHGDSIEDVTTLIETSRNKHLNRLQQLSLLLAEKPKTFQEIIQEIYNKNLQKPSSQTMQTLCYLNYLLEKNELTILNNENRIELSTAKQVNYQNLGSF